MLNAVKVIGFTLLVVGISIFLYGFFVSDYSAITGIGIGTVMGAIFIFLMGYFLCRNGRDAGKSDKGIRGVKLKNRKGAPLAAPFFYLNYISQTKINNVPKIVTRAMAIP